MFLRQKRENLATRKYSILRYIDPPPPLQQIFKNGLLYMESSDNLASSHKTFTYHRQYYSVVDISFE